MAGLISLAAPAPAQGPVVVSGTVLRRSGPDTVAASGARVVLHRLTQGSSGPVDSVHASPAGAFRFRVAPDSGVIYLISARWSGIEYFSPAIPGGQPDAAGAISLLVADTSSRAPVSVTARYLILGAPDADRTRTVVDLFVLRNAGPATRVGSDSTTPSWRHVLPSGTRGHSTGPASEIAAEAMQFAGDTVLVFAPISPGDDRHLMLQHTLSASGSTLRVPLGEGADSVQVVTEEEGVRVSGLTQIASQIIDGKPMARWAGGRMTGDLVIAFPRVVNTERWLVPALAAATVAVMLVAGLFARRFRPELPAPVRPSLDQLVDRIARLDAARQGRDLTELELAAYREERARLKQELTAALAAREAAR